MHRYCRWNELSADVVQVIVITVVTSSSSSSSSAAAWNHWTFMLSNQRAMVSQWRHRRVAGSRAKARDTGDVTVFTGSRRDVGRGCAVVARLRPATVGVRAGRRRWRVDGKAAADGAAPLDRNRRRWRRFRAVRRGRTLFVSGTRLAITDNRRSVRQHIPHHNAADCQCRLCVGAHRWQYFDPYRRVGWLSEHNRSTAVFSITRHDDDQLSCGSWTASFVEHDVDGGSRTHAVYNCSSLWHHCCCCSGRGRSVDSRHRSGCWGPVGGGKQSPGLGTDACVPDSALRAPIFSQRRADSPREDPHGTETVPVSGMRAFVQPVRPPHHAPAYAHRRKTVRLRRVRAPVRA